MPLAALLIAGSAGVALFLGTLHLFFTFASDKFRPRDAELEARMKSVSPVISGRTTMWKAWVGFNASHSMGAVLFGLVYGDLALVHFDWLLESRFLSVLGAVFLCGYLVLGWRYWFYLPLSGIALATLLYLAGWILVPG